METARHRRCKSATALEGNYKIHKHKAVPKSIADSRSYNGGITKEDVSTFESGQNSLKRGSGTPIKKLLAEEMAKESETRRRSPSVIARLMGLDGLPSPHNGHKQQKRLSEKHQHRTTSLGIDRNEQPCEDRSSKMIPVDQQDFKDVYEDMEASHVTNHRSSSRWNANSRFTMPEMVHIQQKFMDAKRLSSNEKLQVSKEFDDTLEILDSNKDLLLNYLEQPRSMLLKQLHDMSTDPYNPLYGHVACLEQSTELEGNGKSWNSGRDGPYKHDISSRQKREDGLLLQSHHHLASYHSCKAEKSQSSVKNGMDILPTRIVVLKPNLVKRVNAVSSVSSPESSHAHLPSSRKRMQHRGSDVEELLSCKKKNSSSGVCFSKTKSRENREIAKEITRQIREPFRPSSGLRGYAGDESSYDVYESDSSSASEVTTLSSRNSFDGNRRIKYSSSGPYHSLVSKEAKKRLSERWKMTHKSLSFEPIAKGSTLGEMLAVPERETVQEPFDAEIGLDGSSEGFTGSSDTSGWDGPLGISSRDGWKDGCARTSSRSKSLPPSVGSGSGKTNGRHESLSSDLLKKEKIRKARSKERKGKVSEKDKFSSKDVRLSVSTSHLCHSKGNDNGLSPDVNSSLIQEDILSFKEDQHEKHLIDCQTPHVTDSSTGFVPAELTNSEPEILNLSFKPSVNLHPKDADFVNEHDDSSTGDKEDANPQEPVMGQSEGVSASLSCTGTEPESSESSKEADHPSPVSVLEVSFVEDTSSSSDCFETVNAQLNELRMQLQLLKIESGGYVGTAMLSSSNTDVLQQQPEVVYEEKSFVGSDSWESSYIVDALLYSGLEDFDFDTFASWHSPECPLGPLVFTNLEKKYNGKTTDLKFERRLLFDRINSALLEIFQLHVDESPWVQPRIIGASKWQKDRVKDYLIKMLANQEHKVNGDRPENRLDREMNWLGFKDNIDMIGKEIEKLLIDDLIGEVVAL